MELTNIQNEVLVGSLLGDGYLFKHPTSKHPYFSIGRKLADLEYLQYEFSFFEELCNTEIKKGTIFDKRSGKTYHQCRFTTRPEPLFWQYYDKWYRGRKTLPDNIYFTPLVCAIWFCDDGCVVVDKRTNRLKIKIATHSFTKEENHRLAEMFRGLFQEHFGIGCDNGKYFLNAADSGTKKFIKYIENDIPTSMRRKITWTPEHFNQPKAYCHLKYRRPDDLNNKEKQILTILRDSPCSQREIADKMGWNGSYQPSTPSGLHLYLKRFLQRSWITKAGIQHSQKNPIKYSITNNGMSALI